MILLVKQAVNGNKDAFVALMEMHKLSMQRAAGSILKNEEDVADAMQETVLNAFEKLHTLRRPAYFKTWLMRILINNCYTILRRGKVIPIEDGIFPEEGKECSWDEAMDVQNALGKISDPERLVMTLYYVEDLSQKEIAKILNISENAVKQRLARSRRHFKSNYGKGVAVNG